jgi:hypothetical protein
MQNSYCDHRNFESVNHSLYSLHTLNIIFGVGCTLMISISYSKTNILGGGPATKPTSSGETSQPAVTRTQPTTSADVSTPSQASSNPGAPAAPKTVLEGLEQRLEKYQSGVQEAEKEENSGKARRMKRIVKVVKIGQENMRSVRVLQSREIITSR